MRISEQFVPVPLIESDDYGSAGIDSDSVHMGRVHGLSALLSFGALTGNSVLKVYAGATAGAKTTAQAFSYRLGAADFKAATADQLGDATAVASTGLTLTAATFDHRMVAIEVDSDQMPEGKPWITIEIDNTASALNVAAIGVARGRNVGHTNPTVI